MDIQYLNKERLVSYANQIRIIQSLGNRVESILEIGIFNSLLKSFLAPVGYSITTADVNLDLTPDLHLDLTSDFQLPLDKFDAIVLFQVLEHIPYETFEAVLPKFAQTTRKYIIISLPYTTECCFIRLQLSFLKRPRTLKLQIPRFWSHRPVTPDEHYWEIGLKGYPLRRIRNSLKQSGLVIKREYQDPLNPYHYFFVLEKKV